MRTTPGWLRFLGKSLSYLLVAALASALTFAMTSQDDSKLQELETVIAEKFIGQADVEHIRDAAASAMVDALGDQWSYYVSAEEYAAYVENKNNSYVGIGVTVAQLPDGSGFDIQQVDPGGSAKEAGILPGDVIVAVEDTPAAELDLNGIRDKIRGEENTCVTLTILRDGEEKPFVLQRRTIKVVVASGEMLPGDIGLVQITNFHSGCAKEAIALIGQLQEQGAKALILDVRNNPGGYVHEMVGLLDHLLPEGVLFREVDYKGNEGQRVSDADCLELPMVVMVNGNSYSAAEFFAACLREYEWAAVVGEKTTGKGYYQEAVRLSDGSAVNLSTGKYFTPNGVSLTEVGGITPDTVISVDEDTAAMIYGKLLPAEEDPQIRAAMEILAEKMG